jgi:hypothetical protein
MTNPVENELEGHKPTREEVLLMLKEMTASYQKLPQHAMYNFVNHADFCSLLLLLVSLFDSERDSS